MSLLWYVIHICMHGFTYSKNTDDDSEKVFEEMPVPIVSYLEHNQLACSERIHCLQIIQLAHKLCKYITSRIYLYLLAEPLLQSMHKRNCVTLSCLGSLHSSPQVRKEHHQ